MLENQDNIYVFKNTYRHRVTNLSKLQIGLAHNFNVILR